MVTTWVQFGMEIVIIEIEDEMRNTILEAQKRLTMVNAQVKTNNGLIYVFGYNGNYNSDGKFIVICIDKR